MQALVIKVNYKMFSSIIKDLLCKIYFYKISDETLSLYQNDSNQRRYKANMM